jgi:cytochrome c oxidase cbb3-type subunit 3
MSSLYKSGAALAAHGMQPHTRGVTRHAARVAVGLLAMLTACDREQRRLRESPPSTTPSAIVRVSELQPGTPKDTTTHTANPYENNAYAISEGQRLFGWYNCAGCHSNGGGGMGPPLMDEKWIYGSAPENIYATIVQGRPNGMPSFGGRIPTTQVWQIVSYVRSLSSLTPSAARSSRSDHMMMAPGSQSLSRPEQPKQSFRPPASEMP